MRALLATLFLSRGTPMLTAGDELGRTQAGNNNAYAQDNPVTWLDWNNADTGLTAFTTQLIALRRRHPALRDDRFLTGAPLDATGLPDVAWLDAGGSAMTVADWQGAGGDVLGVLLYYPGPPADRVLAVFNRGRGVADMVLPEAATGKRWTVELASAPEGGADLAQGRLAVPPRSVVLAAEA
jgi:glycogen operon protein